MVRFLVSCGLLLLIVPGQIIGQEVEQKYDRFRDKTAFYVDFDLPAPEGFRSLTIILSAEWKGSEMPSNPEVGFGATWVLSGRQSRAVPSAPLMCIIDDDRHEFDYAFGIPGAGSEAAIYHLGLDGLGLLAQAKEVECRAGPVEFSMDSNGMQNIRHLYQALDSQRPQ